MTYQKNLFTGAPSMPIDDHLFHISGAPFMDMVYFPEHEQVTSIFFLLIILFRITIECSIAKF
jgi:hypothetical protein